MSMTQNPVVPANISTWCNTIVARLADTNQSGTYFLTGGFEGANQVHTAILDQVPRHINFIFPAVCALGGRTIADGDSNAIRQDADEEIDEPGRLVSDGVYAFINGGGIPLQSIRLTRLTSGTTSDARFQLNTIPAGGFPWGSDFLQNAPRTKPNNNYACAGFWANITLDFPLPPAPPSTGIKLQFGGPFRLPGSGTAGIYTINTE